MMPPLLNALRAKRPGPEQLFILRWWDALTFFIPFAHFLCMLLDRDPDQDVH